MSFNSHINPLSSSKSSQGLGTRKIHHIAPVLACLYWLKGLNDQASSLSDLFVIPRLSIKFLQVVWEPSALRPLSCGTIFPLLTTSTKTVVAFLAACACVILSINTIAQNFLNQLWSNFVEVWGQVNNKQKPHDWETDSHMCGVHCQHIESSI